MLVAFVLIEPFVGYIIIEFVGMGVDVEV